MIYGPDFSSSDEDGLSDDNDYVEFKKRLKDQRNVVERNEVNTEAEQKRRKLQFASSAIISGNYEGLIKELDQGLDVNSDLENSWTPLLLACTVSNKQIVSELLKRGADINQTRESLTPLMLLCNISTEDEEAKINILDCVKMLLDKGADFKAIDRKRRTALMMAAHNGHLEIVKLLLPLIDIEVEDNQRWTALFWAVDGNRVEIVDILLKEGFNTDKIDIRGNTVKDIAHAHGFEDILKLLPQDSDNEGFYVNLNNNQFNFEQTFSNLRKEERPHFFMDICKILYGSKSEQVMPILRDYEIGLLEFLSLSDSKLKDIGVKLPYQRNRIMGGLYKFHKHPFKPKSISVVSRGDLYTNIDVSAAVVTCIKQISAMEASLGFIMENSSNKLDREESKEIAALLAKNRLQIARLKPVCDQLAKKAEMWDSTLKPADRITRKRWNIPWGNLCLSFGLISLIYVYRNKWD